MKISLKISPIIICFCLMFYAESIRAQAYNNLTAKQLDSISSNLLTGGKYKEALDVCETFIIKSKQSDSLYSIALNRKATLLELNGDYEQAEKLFIEVLSFREKKMGKEHPDYAGALSNLGGLYRNLGDYEKAEFLYLQSLEILRKDKNKNIESQAVLLNNIANVYDKTERFEQAKDFYEEAYNIFKSIMPEDDYRLGVLLNNLGAVYNSTQDFGKSEQYYLRSRDIFKKALGESHPYYATTTTSLAVMYERSGQAEKAVELHKNSLQIIKKSLGEKHPNYAMALNNLGKAYLASGKMAEALRCYKEALDIKKVAMGAKHPSYISTLNDLANVFLKTNDLDNAESSLNAAILANLTDTTASFKNLSDVSNMEFRSGQAIIRSLEGLYKVFITKFEKSADKKDLQKGIEALNTALKITEKIRNSFTSEHDKMRNLSENAALLKVAVKTALRSGEASDLEQAFIFAEQNKSILLADATKAQRARNFGLPDSVALAELNLQQKLSKAQKAEIEAKTDEQKAAAKNTLNELNLASADFKKKLEKEFPKYFRMKYAPFTASVAEMQKMLDKETLFLEYLQSDSILYIFCISKDKYKVLSVNFSIKEAAESVKKLRKALSDFDYIKNADSEAKEIYQTGAFVLFEKMVNPAIKAFPNYKSLIIVPDGELGHLPFESFLTKSVGSEIAYSKMPYLINDYKISYNYSAALWKENATNKAAKNNGQILAIAPAYGKAALEAQTRTGADKRRNPQLVSLRNVLSELPAAENEVKSLSGLFSGSFLFGMHASEKNFKTTAADYAVIHLAMHGLLNTEYPILSSLAFSEDGDSIEDNFLQAYEISQLKLNAQLVVLSACETGYGKFQQGEGVMSLARSFMYAGVPSLVVSLWQVNDASTSTIMQLFYKNLAKGMDKAEALQQAKLAYIKTIGADVPKAAHPAYWAPFIIIGDSQPIKIAEKGSGLMYWAIGAIGLLALGGGIYVLRRKKEN